MHLARPLPLRRQPQCPLRPTQRLLPIRRQLSRAAVSACSKAKRLAVLLANIRRIRRRPVANLPARLIRRRPALLLTSMRRPRIRRTVQRQLSLLIPRRHTTTSHRLRLLKEIIHRLRLEPILRAKVSMTVHGMTADLAVVADEVAVTAAA